MIRDNNKSSTEQYASIAKSNMVFGGVKVFQAIIQLLKNKIVAILLGPVGLGVQSLLVSAINTLHLFTSLGLSQSSVREISVENELDGKKKIVKTVSLLAFILGALASIFTFVFAETISGWVFNDIEHKWMFQVISFSLFFETVSNAQIAIFQGLRFVKQLAKMSLVASIASLIVIIPIYYVGRVDAIPYAVLTSYFILASVGFVWRVKIFRADISLSRKDFITNSRNVLGLGVALMISNCVMSLFGLGLNVVINRYGCSEDVGFYNAANACTYYAINILISILSSDYYPRLTSCIHEKDTSTMIVNTQIELLLLVLTPIIFIMVLFPSIIIKILYSNDFLVISKAVQIMSLSLIFRLVWHSLSYIILAKGDKISYLIVDALIGNGLFFIGNIVGFMINKIDGLALSYVIGSVIVMSVLLIWCSYKYRIHLYRSTILLAISLVFLCFGIVLINILITGVPQLLSNIFITIIMLYVVIYQINRRIPIKSYISSFLCKK